MLNYQSSHQQRHHSYQRVCLMNILGDVRGLSADVQCIYEDLCRVSTPDQDMRRKVDLCAEVSSFILSRVVQVVWMERFQRKKIKIGLKQAHFGTQVKVNSTRSPPS